MYGVVMRITETQIVVLCEDGKFRNTPLPQAMPALGDRIAVPDTIFSKKKSKKEFYMYKSWIAATFLILLIGISMFMSVLSSSNQPVAMIAVDINPSVELFVNADDKVKKVSFKNDDALLIMDDKELIDKDFYQALRLIIMKSEKHGFLDPNTQNKVVMISVVGLKNSFQVDVNKILSSNNNYEVYLYDVEKEKQKKAEEMDLSLNKYLVFEKAQEMGIDLNVDDLRLNSFVNTLEQAGLDPQSFFDKKAEKDLTSLENVDSDVDAYNEIGSEKIGKAEDQENEIEEVQDVEEQEDESEEIKDSEDQEKEIEAVEDIEDIKEVEEAKEREDEGYLGVSEFELHHESQNEEKLILKYKHKAGNLEADIERQTDGSKEKYKGDEASEKIEALLVQLALLEDMNEDQVIDRVVTLLKIDMSQLKELEVEIKFISGKEIEFEIENEEDENEKEKDDEE